jgi:hypothetical protein
MVEARRKKQISLSIVAVVMIVLIIVVLFMFSTSKPKDIEITILGVEKENDRFYVNVSLTNNQNTIGWVDDTYLLALDGTVIDLTGGGIDQKINPGETQTLTFFSPQVNDNIVDSPYKLSYTAFPSGVTYTVLI